MKGFKKISFLTTLAVLLAVSTANAQYFAGSLTSPATNVEIGSNNSMIEVYSIVGRFSANTTTAADILSVDVDSNDGATFDFRLCAPDADSDGTPNIGAAKRTFRCSFNPPFIVRKGEPIDLNFTNSDSLSLEFILFYSTVE